MMIKSSLVVVAVVVANSQCHSSSISLDDSGNFVLNIVSHRFCMWDIKDAPLIFPGMYKTATK